MSRKHTCEKEYCCEEKKGLGDCCCSFPTLVILILIILQFNRSGFGFGLAAGTEGGVVGGGLMPAVDNSILFIIALFYLACCNPCKRIGY